LLDENLPKRLKEILPPHKVHTVRDCGWNGVKNGELLRLMLSENFDALITFDRNLKYQQNFKKYSIPVIVLNAPDNSFITLSKYRNKILNLLEKELATGPHEIK
jgi:hypothetical protein